MYRCLNCGVYAIHNYIYVEIEEMAIYQHSETLESPWKKQNKAKKNNLTVLKQILN